MPLRELVSTILTLLVTVTLLTQVMESASTDTAARELDTAARELDEAALAFNPDILVISILFVIGVSILLSVVPSLGRHYSRQRVDGVTAWGRSRRVDTDTPQERTSCVCCGTEFTGERIASDDSERHVWADELLVAGYPVYQFEGGANDYCATCADPMHTCHDGEAEAVPEVDVDVQEVATAG